MCICTHRRQFFHRVSGALGAAESEFSINKVMALIEAEIGVYYVPYGQIGLRTKTKLDSTPSLLSLALCSVQGNLTHFEYFLVRLHQLHSPYLLLSYIRLSYQWRVNLGGALHPSSLRKGPLKGFGESCVGWSRT